MSVTLTNIRTPGKCQSLWLDILRADMYSEPLHISSVDTLVEKLLVQLRLQLLKPLQVAQMWFNIAKSSCALLVVTFRNCLIPRVFVTCLVRLHCNHAQEIIDMVLLNHGRKIFLAVGGVLIL